MIQVRGSGFEKALIGRGYKRKEMCKARKVQKDETEQINRAMDEKARRKRVEKKKNTRGGVVKRQ